MPSSSSFQQLCLQAAVGSSSTSPSSSGFNQQPFSSRLPAITSQGEDTQQQQPTQLCQVVDPSSKVRRASKVFKQPFFSSYAFKQQLLRQWSQAAGAPVRGAAASRLVSSRLVSVQFNSIQFNSIQFNLRTSVLENKGLSAAVQCLGSCQKQQCQSSSVRSSSLLKRLAERVGHEGEVTVAQAKDD